MHPLKEGKIHKKIHNKILVLENKLLIMNIRLEMEKKNEGMKQLTHEWDIDTLKCG
jgi:hypothetical protein